MAPLRSIFRQHPGNNLPNAKIHAGKVWNLIADKCRIANQINDVKDARRVIERMATGQQQVADHRSREYVCMMIELISPGLLI
jgi:hypothetical protein